jgi:hypothetical protein
MIDSWQPPSIERVRSFEARRLAVLPAAGLAGDLAQDLGRGALLVEIVGSLASDEARDEFLKNLRQKFLDGSPVSFVADIVKESELDRVLIEALEFQESAQDNSAFRYRIVLREYTEPPEPPGASPDFGLELDAGLDLDASLGLDLLDFPAIAVAVPKLDDLLSPLRPAAANLKTQLSGAGAILSPLKNLFGGT